MSMEEKINELKADATYAITEVLKELPLDEEFGIYNDFCNATMNYDDEVYYCDEFTINELLEGLSPYEILEKYRDIDLNWEYMIFTCYGLEEWHGIEDNYSYSDVAEWMLEDSEDCGNSEIEEIISKYYDDLEAMEWKEEEENKEEKEEEE